MLLPLCCLSAFFFFFFLLFLATGMCRFVLFLFIVVLHCHFFGLFFVLVLFNYGCRIASLCLFSIQVVDMTTLRNWYNFVLLFSIVLG